MAPTVILLNTKAPPLIAEIGLAENDKLILFIINQFF